jgi:hypothetical protein
VSEEKQHEGAPSRIVSSDRYQHAYSDALQRFNRLEQSQARWLEDFHRRTNTSPPR